MIGLIYGILSVFTARYEKRKSTENSFGLDGNEKGKTYAALDPFFRILNGYAVDDRTNGKVRRIK